MRQKGRMLRETASFFMVLFLVLGIFPIQNVQAGVPSGIAGNGTGGIYIDINEAPYSSKNFYPEGFPNGIAYTDSGCTWFAASRVQQLIGGNITIWSGASWYTGGHYADYGFDHGTEIRPHSLACYSGHVAVIEEVIGDTVILSEGGVNPADGGTDANGYCHIIQTTVYEVERTTKRTSFLGYVYFDANYSTITVPTGTQTICDGDYRIVSAMNRSFALDAAGGGTANGSNVQLYQNTTDDWQVFHITYMGDGYYKITNRNTGKSLDVANGSREPCTNVQMFDCNGSDAQQWVIRYADDGNFYIISKCNGLYLDVDGAASVNGANIQMYTDNGNMGQKFRFIAWGNGSGQSVADGYYRIAAYGDKNMCIDIDSYGTNAQLYSIDTDKTQVFYIEYQGEGYYKITQKDTTKVLDVSMDNPLNCANVWIYADSGSDAQRWIIRDSGSGYYNIISKSSGLFLDIDGGKYANCTNIQMYMGVGSAAQRFVLIPQYVEPEIDSEPYTRMRLSDGSLYEAFNTQMGQEGEQKKAEQVTFTHEGSFDEPQNIGFAISNEMLTNVGDTSVKNNKAVLLQYESGINYFALLASAKIEDGNARFNFTTGDSYVLVYAINGDTTGDGLVDIEDLLNVLYHSSKRKTMSPLNVGIADTNGDNEVDIEDVLATLYYTSGRRSSL